MKRFQSIGTLLSVITGLLVVVLVSAFASKAVSAYRTEQLARSVLSDVDGARSIMSAKVALRGELAIANLVLEAPEGVSTATYAQLRRLHRNTQTALDQVLREVATRPLDDARKELPLLRSSDAAYRALFPAVMAAITQPRAGRDDAILPEWKRVTTILARQLAVQSEILGQHIAGADPFIDHMMEINDNAWNMRSNAGADRGFMQTAVIDNRVPGPDLLQSLAEIKGKIDARWGDIEADAQRSTMPAPLKAVILEAQKIYFTGYRALRASLLARLGAGEKLNLSGKAFVENSNPALVSLLAISATALDLMAESAREKAAAAHRSFFIAIALMLLSIGLACFTGLYVMWRVIRPLQRITGTLTSIAGGDMAAPIPYEQRADEIGQFARALQMFRDGAVERERLKTEVLESRSAKETAEASNRVKAEFLPI